MFYNLGALDSILVVVLLQQLSYLHGSEYGEFPRGRPYVSRPRYYGKRGDESSKYSNEYQQLKDLTNNEVNLRRIYIVEDVGEGKNQNPKEQIWESPHPVQYEKSNEEPEIKDSIKRSYRKPYVSGRFGKREIENIQSDEGNMAAAADHPWSQIKSNTKKSIIPRFFGMNSRPRYLYKKNVLENNKELYQALRQRKSKKHVVSTVDDREIILPFSIINYLRDRANNARKEIKNQEEMEGEENMEEVEEDKANTSDRKAFGAFLHQVLDSKYNFPVIGEQEEDKLEEKKERNPRFGKRKLNVIVFEQKI